MKNLVEAVRARRLHPPGRERAARREPGGLAYDIGDGGKLFALESLDILGRLTG